MISAETIHERVVTFHERVEALAARLLGPEPPEPAIEAWPPDLSKCLMLTLHMSEEVLGRIEKALSRIEHGL